MVTGYEPLLKDDEKFNDDEAELVHNECCQSQGQNRSVRPTAGCFLIAILKYLLIIAASATVGYFSGQPIAGHGTNDLLPPAGETTMTLKYNRTYGEAPSAFVDAAWQSMFPGNPLQNIYVQSIQFLRDVFLAGRGFVRHHSISPDISGLAVFHELHCLVRAPDHRQCLRGCSALFKYRMRFE